MRWPIPLSLVLAGCGAETLAPVPPGSLRVVPTFVPDCIAPQTFAPAPKWSWSEATSEPGSLAVMVTPLVVDLDNDGSPEVVAPTFNIMQPTSRVGTLRIFNGATGALVRTIPSADYRVERFVTPAAADLDGDGAPEIVSIRHRETSDPFGSVRLYAFKADGSLLWMSDPVPVSGSPEYSTIAIADLDGNGSPELVVGSSVVDAQGHLLWQGSLGAAHNLYGHFSAVADLDGDGMQEVVAGRTIYDHQGTPLQNYAGIADGSVAIANCDADPGAEIFVMGASFSGPPTYSIIDDNGSLRVSQRQAPTNFPDKASAPAAGDLDGDGDAEWVVSFQSQLVALDCDGNLVWAVTTSDDSGASGPAVFDFEGDGALEVVFADETHIKVYRGTSGAEIYAAPRISATGWDTPVIADLDGDGHADLLVTYADLTGAEVGLKAFSNTSNNWVATRRTWNQHTYAVTNVDDSGAVPASPLPSWQDANLFRGNAAYCVQR